MLALVMAVAGTALTVPATAESAWADTAPTATDRPATVSADPLPTWQVTGVVWSQVTVGTTVYATGSFTKARPPGMWKGGPTEVDVAHLIAYDITTGERVASFHHTLDAQGLAITASPDGSRVYVGGDFTTVDGVSRPHLAAFDTRTGALVPGFAASVNGQVKALTATAQTVYAGGAFTGAGPDDAPRTFLASFAAGTGALTSWAPAAVGGYVWALTMTPDRAKVVAGGQFSTLNGATVNGMGALDAKTGATLTWRANTVIKDFGPASIDTLTTDGTLVYGGGFAYKGGNFEGSFALDPADGSIRWLVDCLGDTYDVQPVGDVLYSVGHAHDCTMIGGFSDTKPRTRWQYGVAFTTRAVGTNDGPDAAGRTFKGQPAAALLHWYPKLGIGVATGQYQAAWSVTSAAGYVSLGGEFPTVGGKPQQGLTRYAVAPPAPNRTAPKYDDTAPVRTGPPPTTAVATGSSVKVTWGSAWDEDNERLTYRVYRDRGSAAEKLVTTVTSDSAFWKLPAMSTTDKAVPDGGHSYQVVVSDPFGNVLEGPSSGNIAVGTTNAAPLARFTSTADRLAVSFSGSASSDTDGRVTAWSWSFGDGTSGTGATASRTYAAPGSYPVTLTVTDDRGATASTTQTVVVTRDPPPLARDDFERTTASGWGTADQGGTWTPASSSALSTADGVGLLRLAAGSGPSAQLGTPSTDTDLQLTFAVDKAPAAASLLVRAVPRGTVAAGYVAKVYAPATGRMTLYLVRTSGGTETSLGSFALPQPLAAGQRWVVRTQAVGTSPTVLRARVWAEGTSEPTTWQVSTTDTTAALQTAAGIAVGGYASSGVTNAPVTLSIDRLLARPTSG